uniref:Protein kinase domain-containing protein n=1 Tax=Biomphalaria glabrata TaxID=6526 RepID=A0A2C9L998_BIOGL
MHLLGETDIISNDNKTNMSGASADIRLRRQVPVTNKPPLKLRLTSRTSTHQQQHPTHSRERSSSWHPDTTTTLSVYKSSAASSSKAGAKVALDIGTKTPAQSSVGRSRSDSTPANKLVIHHQRQNLKNRFQLQKTLGEGTYGKVKLASDKSTGELVAIKYIKKTKIHDDNDLARIRREIHILSSLRHKH